MNYLGGSIGKTLPTDLTDRHTYGRKHDEVAV
jgi:hypothetical protein